MKASVAEAPKKHKQPCVTSKCGTGLLVILVIS